MQRAATRGRSDPVVAVATAAGRGAIGVIRVSGQGLDDIAVAITGKAIGSALKPRYATYGPFLDATGEVIDHGLTFWFPGPDSYTGEDVLEFQGHGGPVVMQILLNRILQAGQHLELRIARPGEFTERAFLNNKLDLAQAEAVADLIDASSAQAARSASRSLAGEFSQRVNALVGQLTHLRMLVEATLDFPEEEVDALEGADAAGQLAKLQSALTDLQQAAGRGVLLRDGMSVVIAGAPNVGKSSLLNALAGEESAIVSPIAGTTRDKVSEDIQIDGVPLHIVDTAGLHDTDDAIERIGIERTRAAIARADVVLHVRVAHHGEETACLDDALASEVIAIARSAGAAQLDIFNKIDLLNMAASSDGDKAVWLSADTGLGLDLLRARLLALAGWQGAAESQFIARERHLQALNAAQGHLTRANQAWAGGLELLAEELRLAQRALSAITGEFTADDLLGEIFSSFCIGK